MVAMQTCAETDHPTPRKMTFMCNSKKEINLKKGSECVCVRVCVCVCVCE